MIIPSRQAPRIARANYVVLHHESTDQCLMIGDVGPHHRHPTVTNDVSAVVEELLARGELRPGQRLMYRDSARNLDEIVIESGRFAGFRCGPIRGPRSEKRNP